MRPLIHMSAHMLLGNDFILMDDNARPHRARLLRSIWRITVLERMEWPTRSPDLNDRTSLGLSWQRGCCFKSSSRSLHELKQGLFCVWSSLPIPVSDNLINSMGNRCRQCIQDVILENEERGHLLTKKWKILHVKECLKNHNGSAGMMETVRNGSYISAFIKSSFWRDIHLTSGMAIPKHSHLLLHPIRMEKISKFKIECVGHVQKRMGTRLRKLKQMSSKLSDGKSIGEREG
ncbi:transposable element Tcb2 transposase [Trichonephila clavipes]|nr:transposable element Tcb2 transposase [Trichonephila clavipes]